ncbi:MAG: hypothetical protein ACAI35_12465 [Candidatus Methylacidiphilales bacterium]|nr:hypothetical protein [Candidatus Methylacidiphilales bacterium]
MLRYVTFVLPALVLGAWGTTFIHAVATGRLNTLLHPSFRPPAMVCGVVLLVLAVWHLLFFETPTARPVPAVGAPLAAKAAEEAPQFAASATGTGLAPLGSMVTWLILLVPLLVSAYTAPGSFSQLAVRQRANEDVSAPASYSSLGIRSSSDSEAVPDPSGKPVYQEVSNILDMGDRPELAKLWEGKRVRTVAQFYPGKDPGTFQAVRFFMFCCANDATPLPVVVRGADPLITELKPMDWFDVVGLVRVKPTDQGPRAEIEMETLKRSPRPAEPYLY